MDTELSKDWFKEANLLVFTPEHRPLLHEIPKPEESAHDLEENIYMMSHYTKAAEFNMDPEMQQRSTMSIKLNEIYLYDDILFPGFGENERIPFISVESIQNRKRDLLTGIEGEIMFNMTMELSPVRGIYIRERTSILYLGGLFVAVSLLMYHLLDFLFGIVKATQGSGVLQALLWGLYQTRRIKHISLSKSMAEQNKEHNQYNSAAAIN